MSMKSDSSFNPEAPVFNEVPNKIELDPEEVKIYKDCLTDVNLKGGVPWAIAWEAYHYAKEPAKQRSIPRIAIRFFANVCLGTFLFAPYCYMKLSKFHSELMKKQKRKESSDIFPVIENTEPQTYAAPDFSYPVDTPINLSELDNNFSSDFSSPILLYDEEKDLKKKPETTYDDLRARNRKNFDYQPPVSSLNSDLSPPSSSTPANAAPARPRRVIKNKYGDEIE